MMISAIEKNVGWERDLAVREEAAAPILGELDFAVSEA